MTIEEMRQKKLQKGYSHAQISNLSGVPLGTVQKIFSGETAHPRYATLQALEQVLTEQKYNMKLQDNTIFSYKDSVEKKQGEYTIEDYFVTSDKIRVELIDGVLYDMDTPTFGHQKITGEIYRQIANYIIENNRECEAGIAPVDVQLDCDNKTMMQPDIIILFDKEKILRGKVFGAPDFVLEVVSFATKRKDYFKKLEKYENARVREYWIFDPYKKQVVVFFFEGDIYAQVYDLKQPVPIYIFEGKLQIYFERILTFCDKKSLY
ncbi:MAG: Uma2 family endonuclease [Lachnospiraceae bacterium]